MPLFRYYPSNPKNLDPEMEKKIFFHSLLFPAIFVLLLWIVKIIELTAGLSFVKLGIFPRHLNGLQGVLFSPFIHSDFSHLISNSLPFFILGFMLIYFYRRISYRIFFLLYILSGISTWFMGREAWHIGASGVVYALAAFHFVSGIIRSDVRLLTLSAIVVFLYGGLVWGLLPIRPEISWEGHLSGAIFGVALAFYYRKYIVRREKFDWEDEPDDDEEEDDFTNDTGEIVFTESTTTSIADSTDDTPKIK
ncbi:rhomboid family intramembrane serine protease [Draconibacterium sp. IB214405]|uniref:rhomboid family intramembrane serine protease n=1 Tax=Draconibacterium sp. IB214405 TaxID=3097352 RepID=UPI002A12F422|nr:rhomboid family intramembrane serine protease [Draconibacterium sp. IB214405]MDX8339153.1 rhomboid family intramembrane serine protease [Draconibacterium sp. IB214405]